MARPDSGGGSVDMNRDVRQDSADGSMSGTKRRQSPGAEGRASTRAKRNRYISIACNECKRRKIKCNGQTPCMRCGNLNLECLYAPNCCSNGFRDSEEFKQMNAQISVLQEQVDTLFASMNALRNGESSASTIGSDQNYLLQPSRSVSQASVPIASPSQQRPKVPVFQGPTSTAFSFDVAKSSLQTMGIHTSVEDAAYEGIAPKEDSPVGSPRPPHPSKDPLWLVSRDEAIRLARVYEEEMGIMYPIINIEKVIQYTIGLYGFMGAATRSGLAQMDQPGSDHISDDDANILKMVLAAALMAEGSGRSNLGKRLFDSVRKSIESKLWASEVDVKAVILLVLACTYQFYRDEEVLAWRTIGLTARMCLFMGLHRRESLLRNFQDEEDRQQAIRLFWSIYVLDRRWSFGTGMPFALQDSDIDPSLPEPDASTPYLTAMLAYSRIASRVWRSVAGFDSPVNEVKKDYTDYLDYQILQWQKSLPDELQLVHPDDAMGGGESRAIRRLRLLLYLRSNQMRILVYRPVLHSLTSIMENLQGAKNVVEVAKDSIRVLTKLNQTTDIYRRGQVLFNYFLVSALAVLFLAVSHAPAQFSSICRDEFYMALDLVKGFSTKSQVAKRLWRTIRDLKEVGPKLGLFSRSSVHFTDGPIASISTEPDITDAHSSAAVAMANLASGHPVAARTEIAMFEAPNPISPYVGNSPNGFQMSSELTYLFEAAGGYGNVMSSAGDEGTGNVNGYSSHGDIQSQGGSSGLDFMPPLFDHEGLSRIVNDLF